MPRLLCLFSFSCLFSVFSDAQNLPFTIFSVEDGLPQSGVYDLLQDSQGYLWVATENGGAARYDGSKFEVWNTSNGLSDDVVRCLYEDQQGIVYFGTESGGVTFLNPNNQNQTDTISGLPNKHVRAILHDAQGRLCVATLGGGIWRSDGKTVDTLSKDNGLPHNKIRALQLDQNDQLWAGTDGGLCQIKEDEIIVYTIEDGLSDNKILTLFEDDSGVLWVGTESGLCYYDSGRFITCPSSKLSKERVRSIAQTGEGNYWFGTKEGVYELMARDLNSEEWPLTFINKTNGLSNERIRKIIRDRNHAMWVGTFIGGICRLTDESFSYFTADEGFPENNVTAIFHDSTGDTWVGTFDGSIFRYSNKELHRVYSSEAYEADDAIRDFAELPGGTICAATTASGILHFKGDVVIETELKFGQQIYDITIKDERQLICSENGAFPVNFSLAANVLKAAKQCRVAQFSGRNKLLIGTTHGLITTTDEDNDGVFESWLKIDGTSGIEITAIVEDSKNNIWCGTQREGLFKIKGEKSKHYKSSQYLSSYNIRLLVLDSFENLWVGTSSGLDLLELDPGQTLVLNSQHFDSKSGFFGVETNKRCAALHPDGSLWFGTIRGVTRYVGSHQYINPAPPLIRLTGIELFYEPVDWQARSVSWEGRSLVPLNAGFKHDENHLTMNFDGIDLSAPEDVRFQYKLDGQVADWSPTSYNKSITFNNLSPGEYTFKVRSCNSQGLWNEEPTTFSFSIAKPFYLETWFIVFMFLSGSALIWAFIRVRLRILRREKQMLEERVKDRTSELEDQKQKSDELLLNILPHETAEELKLNGTAETRHYEMASVLFSDFQGFTMMSEHIESSVLVESLDEFFRTFDRCTTAFGVEKIKTIGDAYMCAAGLPVPDAEHAVNLVSFAIKMREELNKINLRNKQMDLPVWNIRIGIHSGPVIAGVVGEKKFAYDIWGDTVNIASRMESSSEVGQINISEATYRLVKDHFLCKPRGEVIAKNKGKMIMYFVESPIEENIDESIYKEG
jgi:ligand-binding sensor domain-containing protein/class 3 adenylate cyclase